MFQDVDDVGEVNDGQENRTFIQFAETVRNGLAARGVAVDRIYEDDPTHRPAAASTTARALPASLKKPTFAWNGDGADVSAAWNQGRFMVVHRDHGWSDGWGDPFFTTTEVDALTNSNDNLPVVLSINCASAQYDTDETSFVQNALVKPTGGAVGVFGDTRNSPSWQQLADRARLRRRAAADACCRARARRPSSAWATRSSTASCGSPGSRRRRARDRRRRRQHAQRAVPVALLR